MRPKVYSMLCTVTKICKEAKCPSMDEWIKKRWYIYIYTHTMEYYLAIKKLNFAFCSNMDGAGGYYAKWNKVDKERQILHDSTYMWNLKIHIQQVNIKKRKRLTDIENKPVVTSGDGETENTGVQD